MNEKDKIIKSSFILENKSSKLIGRPKPSLSGSSSNFRVSSRGESKEGLGETINPYNINIFNLIEDENTVASRLRLDLVQLQDEINRLDLDGRIRMASGVEFKKNYISTIQKWLARTSDGNIKEMLDSKMNFNYETERILECLNVKNAQEGVKKLFKFFHIIDSLVLKMTELEAIVMAKYDDNFTSFIKNNSPNLVPNVMSGISICRFQIPTVNLQRFQELITFTNKIASESNIKSQIQKGKFSFDVSQLTTKDEIVAAIKSNDFVLPSEESTNLLLKVLEESIDVENKLNLEIEELLKEKEHYIQKNAKAKPEKTEKVDINKEREEQKASNDPLYYIRLIDELREFYKTQISNFENEIKKLNEKISESNIQKDQLREVLIEFEQKIEILKKEKKNMMDSFSKNIAKKEDYEDKFDEVLREEFSNMQKGYESKIEKLNDAILQVKKDKARDVLEMKQQLNREIETKTLLMKKLATFISY